MILFSFSNSIFWTFEFTGFSLHSETGDLGKRDIPLGQSDSYLKGEHLG